ncbi:translocation/assembly module TamB domain-containing protein [Klebsiella sp. BIGb0407]|uniref:autotransporter assembly complex protein TamB n=1 Tax=Klebsiella sp. BIGb0407 TaxID=2940603 RepID=UPI002167150C|nr:translocation/assembly module TamB domain-containing protein [Klebsiella sp. BIGb0407]MCS3431416.1 translocation and assembly module TamB [Klebsiella sp. BIGb0407]
MSRWKKISLAVLIVVLVLVGSVGFLVGTTSGLHLLFNAANRWVPGLNIGHVDGGWRNLTIKDLRYQQPGVDVKAGTVHLEVDLGCLWDSSLCVNDLSLADADIAIDTSKMPPAAPVPEDDTALNLSTPYPLKLSHVGLKNISLSIDGTSVALSEFSSGLQWQDINLTLLPTTLQGLQIALPKTPVVETAEELEPPAVSEEEPLSETLNKLFAEPFLPQMADVNLPLNLDIQQFTATDLRLRGDTELTVHSLLLKASSINGDIKLDTLRVDSSQGKVDATGTARLQNNWPVNLSLNSTLNIEPVIGEQVALQVSGALRETLDIDLALSGPVNVNLKAQTELAEAGLPLNLAVDSKQLYWPLSGDKAYQADDFKFRFSGKMTDYKLSLKSALQGKDLPEATLFLDGQGNTEQFTIDKLRLAALQGNTELTGIVDWSKAISWRADLTLAGINTAKQFPEWPAKLDGKIKTTGSLYGGSWQIDIPELKLAGNVKENKVNVQGQIRGNNYMQWNIPDLRLELGRNKADIKGEFGQKDLNLDAIINAPGLDNILPGLGGAIKGSVKVRGEVDAPQVLADINASNLRFQDFSVARILVKGDVVSHDVIRGDMDLRMERITVPDLNVALVTVGIKGEEKNHRLQLRIQSEPVSGQLTLSGNFDRKLETWTGQLSDTRFDTPVGPWRLNRAMSLAFSNEKQQVEIGPHCWINPDAELCVPQPIEAGAKGHAAVNLNRFNLNMIKPYLPAETQAAGIFSGKANVSWDSEAGGLPQGKVTLNGQGVKVTQDVNGQSLPLAFEQLNLNAEIKDNLAQAGWFIKLVNNGQLDGEVKVSDPQGKRNLGGNVNIRNLSLDMVNAIFTRGEKVQGLLNTNLRLGGNLQRPQVYGQLQLNNLDIAGNFMPVEMQPSQMAVEFNGMNSVLQGTLRTRQGQIVLNGDADWTVIDNWRARIAAKGDKLRITVPPMARLDVSPDVEFIATPSAFTLNGYVDIPWARITVHDLPESAVGVSSDVVMLNENLQPIETRTASIPINSNLKIRIGNNIWLNAFGLRARLTGDLAVTQDKQGLGLNGQISIPQGRFRAYGQDLIVRKGELLFSGPPEQPYVNIEAIRNPQSTENNVIAGVRVLGLAPEPSVQLFSVPGMSQQEILSYLLRGQSLSNSGGDGDVMTSMLVGLGVAQSGQIVGKIGETFGVSNLTLDTAGVGDSSQVVVSGYVLPGLQVKYGVGIFDSLATLTLRYRLMPRLYLEAVSGIDQALDLLYQFEF